MSKQLTNEELAVLKYIREKTMDNKFHRFYPKDVVIDNKSIHDIDAVLGYLENRNYIKGGGWQTDMSEKDPSRREYTCIAILAEGLRALYGDAVVVRLGVAIDSRAQRPFQ